MPVSGGGRWLVEWVSYGFWVQEAPLALHFFQAYYRTTLEEYLHDPDHSERLEAWNRFCAEGGVTNQDLYHWRQGRPMPSAIKTKHAKAPPNQGRSHLRLVSSKIIRYRPRFFDGGEAA